MARDEGTRGTGRMLRVEGGIWVREGGEVGGYIEGVGELGEGVSWRRLRRISIVRLRGMIRGPARAERNCEVRRGIAEMEVVKHDGWW